MTIKVGDAVRLKPTGLAHMGLPHRKLTGGEAVVTNISTDKHGMVYTVRLNRNERMRNVRREQLVVHHKQNRRKTRDKGKRERA